MTLPAHSIVKSAAQLAERVSEERVRRRSAEGSENAQEPIENKRNNTNLAEECQVGAKKRRQVDCATVTDTDWGFRQSSSYPDLCWAQPTTVWTYPDGMLPSRSLPGCQMCSGQPCEPRAGWQAAGVGETAVCAAPHAHLQHLVGGERDETGKMLI